MRWTVDRLRVGILILAVVLLLSIAGSILYGRWRVQHLTRDIPAPLGLQIQQTTQGFVLSKTDQGRTIFQLHAARAIAFKTGGLVSLRDVAIDMYDREDNQVDTITGKDFQYDRENQTVQAQGEAHIMLHLPATGYAVESGKAPELQVIHITTHGLTFNQKTGIATCSGEVDFRLRDSSGRAVGATYDSRQGKLRLISQVVLSTVLQQRPTVVHATQATYDRDENRIQLQKPHYISSTPGGEAHGSAETAVVSLLPDGSVAKLDAAQAVEIVDAGGNRVRSAAMEVRFHANNQPQQARFLGGVQLLQQEPDQRTAGSSREAMIDFSDSGHPRRLTLEGDVQLQQEIESGKDLLNRTIAARHLVVDLLREPRGPMQMQTAEASGDAVFTSQNTVAGQPSQKSTIAAQVLTAKFLAGNEIQQVDGTGQTQLRMLATNGDVNISTGNKLTLHFARGTSAVQRKSPLEQSPHRDSRAGNDTASHSRMHPGGLAANPISTAVQTGNVVLKHLSASASHASQGTAKAPAAAQEFTATATKAEYNGAGDTLTLTGEPEFHDATLKMAANQFEVYYASQKVLASGEIEATLLPGSQAEVLPGGLLSGNSPVHIVARRALLLQNMQTATFTGQARLWQGSNTVEAPVIEISKKSQTLLAYGNNGRSCMKCIQSTFLEQPTEHPGSDKGQSQRQTGGSPTVLRVLSGHLLYSDAERKASFYDNVEAIGAAGDLFADRVNIFLNPAASDQKSHSTAGKTEMDTPGGYRFSQPSVEKIVAEGKVRLVQPGRRATGSKLVYTAADGRLRLTGDGKISPKIVDASRGTVTGQELTFASQTQAIVVSGSSNELATTKTRVQPK